MPRTGRYGVYVALLAEAERRYGRWPRRPWRRYVAGLAEAEREREHAKGQYRLLRRLVAGGADLSECPVCFSQAVLRPTRPLVKGRREVGEERVTAAVTC